MVPLANTGGGQLQAQHSQAALFSSPPICNLSKRSGPKDAVGPKFAKPTLLLFSSFLGNLSLPGNQELCRLCH